jgi:hypothetical protein
MSVTINGTSGLVFNDASTQATAATGFGFKNRIINGAMVIDQRNAGASITPSSDGTYSVDRWCARMSTGSKFSMQQNAGSVTTLVTTGFNNYLGITSTSSYTASSSDLFALEQVIEGNNVQDLQWGTANAKSITLSFWVYSSKTGTFGGSLFNNAANRSYPFTYTITAANTWEYETITIVGDTGGSWTQTTGAGIYLNFDLGSGSSRVGTAGSWAGATYWGASGCQSIVATSGATFYITGVQLEKGSTATSFDYRPYGTELALCQRYYYKVKATSAGDYFGAGMAYSTTKAVTVTHFKVTMRTAPTSVEQSGTASHYRVLSSAGSGITCSSVPVVGTVSAEIASTEFTVSSGLTAGNGTLSLSDSGANGYLAWSAEL